MRPTIPEWDRILMDEYARGASDEEVALALRITKRKFINLYETDEAFRDFVDTGRDWAKAYWLKIGRESLNDKTFNGPLWYNNMKNRWGWADKTEVADKTSGAQDAESLRKQVTDLLNKTKVQA